MEKQVNEIRALQSIFFLEDEFTIEEENEFLQMEKSEAKPRFFGPWNLLVKIMEADGVFARIIVPQNYPHEDPPSIIIKSSQLTNKTLDLHTHEIQTHVEKHIWEKNECLYDILVYIKEYFRNLHENDNDLNVSENENECDNENSKVYKRAFIKFHHIKAKSKRKFIVNRAKDLGLFGFSRPGSPGIIYVEGLPSDVDTYLFELKSLSWKKMQITCTETSTCLYFFYDHPSFQEKLDSIKNCFHLLDEKGLADMYFPIFQ